MVASSVSLVASASANMVTTRPRFSQGKQQHRSTQPWNQNQNQHRSNNYKYDNRVSKGYQGRYQLCGVHGDSAKRCPQLTNPHATTSATLTKSSYPPWQPRANLALGSQTPANAWLLDSGGTHHMTSDLHNMALH